MGLHFYSYTPMHHTTAYYAHTYTLPQPPSSFCGSSLPSILAVAPLSKCTSACCVRRARLVRVGREGGVPCLLLPPALCSALLLLLEHTSNSVMGAPQWRCCVRSTCGSTMAQFHAHLSRTRWARLQPRVHLTTLDLALLPSMLH